jgi:hypothetical protein
VTLHPWLSEQLSAARRADTERSVRRAGLPRAARAAAPRRRRTRPVVLRRVGGALIVLGRRLAGPENAPARLTVVGR